MRNLRHVPRRRNPPRRRLQPRNPTKMRRQPNRPPAIAPHAPRAQPPRDRRRLPARRSTRRTLQRPRVPRPPHNRVVRLVIRQKLRAVRLAHNRRPRRLQPRYASRIRRRPRRQRISRPTSRRHPRHMQRIFNRQHRPMQWPRPRLHKIIKPPHKGPIPILLPPMRLPQLPRTPLPRPNPRQLPRQTQMRHSSIRLEGWKL